LRLSPNNDNRKPLQITALLLLKSEDGCDSVDSNHHACYQLRSDALTHMMLSKEMKNDEHSCKLFLYFCIFVIRQRQEKGKPGDK